MPRKPAFVSRTALFEFFACLCEVVTISGVAARNARRKQKEKSGEARLLKTGRNATKARHGLVQAGGNPEVTPPLAFPILRSVVVVHLLEGENRYAMLRSHSTPFIARRCQTRAWFLLSRLW